MAAPAPLPPGNNIGVQRHSLSYQVLRNGGVEAEGLSGKNRELYMIRADFGNGKRAKFNCESKNLETALKMIEFFGNKTQGLDAAGFKAQVNSLRGERLYMDIADDHARDGTKTGNERVTAYKTNRHGNGLEYVFSQNPTHVIPLDVVHYINDHYTPARQAELRRAREEHELHLRMQRVN